jgi:UDP-4-amino-4,6-dideoxy-N-acetyl-beta-L-altrosamine transaminase
MIPYARQTITAEDEAAVLEALRSGLITQGPRLEAFENALSRKVGSKYAVCLNSATSGLHLAYLAVGVGPGDVVITSPNTFLATANAALLCGAEVDFADIDPDTFNLCPLALEARLELHQKAGRSVKAVVPVHLAGQPCDMSRIEELARHHGAAVIEDASHAVGGVYDKAFVGSCTHSDITVFSFHPVKIITAAEGGAALTNNADLARRMTLLRSHGQTRAPHELEKPDEGPWYYEQHLLGLNYRMTELQAALGDSQLRRLDDVVARRRALADRYDELLAGLPVQSPHRAAGRLSSWHLYIIKLLGDNASKRREVFEHLRASGIGVQVHYIPVHLQPYYRRLGFLPGDFPIAEDVYEKVISLPLFPDLTENEQDRVVVSLNKALGAN